MKSLSLKDLVLSLEELRDLDKFHAQKRGIIDYGNMSNDELSLLRRQKIKIIQE